MPTILAPAPRHPQQHPLLLPHSPQPSSDILHAIHTRTFLSPPPLLSPISLQNSKSPTPCGPPHKRRPSSRLLARSTRRRRHVQRIDSPLDAFGRTPIFDRLSWAPALEMPCPVNCDIADISQLPLDEDPLTFSDTVPASGPVRRRKTSLRSNPLGSGHESPPGEPLQRQYLPIHRSPRTPPPHVPFDPSRVTFHNLMPVFPRGINPSAPF